jgi:hypothetical protein
MMCVERECVCVCVHVVCRCVASDDNGSTLSVHRTTWPMCVDCLIVPHASATTPRPQTEVCSRWCVDTLRSCCLGLAKIRSIQVFESGLGAETVPENGRPKCRTSLGNLPPRMPNTCPEGAFWGMRVVLISEVPPEAWAPRGPALCSLPNNQPPISSGTIWPG